VDWHAALYALGLWFKRGGPDRPEPWPAPPAQKDDNGR
jgi:hypothetical protein